MKKCLCLLLFAVLLLSGCGSAGQSSAACEEIEITDENLFDYFEWETREENSVTDVGASETTVNHYLKLKSAYEDLLEDSSVVVRVIYESTSIEDGEEMQSWPITAIVGIPSEEPVYSEVLGEDSSIPEEVEVTFVEGDIALRQS